MAKDAYADAWVVGSTAINKDLFYDFILFPTVVIGWSFMLATALPMIKKKHALIGAGAILGSTYWWAWNEGVRPKAYVKKLPPPLKG